MSFFIFKFDKGRASDKLYSRSLCSNEFEVEHPPRYFTSSSFGQVSARTHYGREVKMYSKTFEDKIQAVITLFVILSLTIPTIYGMMTGNFELLDKFIELVKMPLGIIIAYYFGARYLQGNR